MSLERRRHRIELGAALTLSVGLISILVSFCQPQWETNDDVGMSMVAHGYGLAATGSPNLIFSNVLWGHVVRAIPQVGGVLGYSIATLGVLVLFGALVLYTMRVWLWGWTVSLALVTLLLVRPVVFPQFTVNAGLMTVAAVLCWRLYGVYNRGWALGLGCFFAFGGYLVRSQEFWLVGLVALPLLPWAKVTKDRFAWGAIIALTALMASAHYLNRQAYEGEEWRQFNEVNHVRAAFTDFGAAPLLKQQPEILSRYNYSPNDISLIGTWFFVDEAVANPIVLKAMLDDLGPIPSQRGSLESGWMGIKALIDPALLPLTVAALVSIAVYPSRWVCLSWVLCLSAFFAIGLSGRPGVIRIYVPVVSLLLISPLLHNDWRLGGIVKRRWLVVPLVLCTAAIFTLSRVFYESKVARAQRENVLRGLDSFPSDPIVVWGGAFPFEAVYPVLRHAAEQEKYRLYGLGVFTLAPFSTASAEEHRGRGMIRRLLSAEGVPLLAENSRILSLATYCEEHHAGVLIELSREEGRPASLRRFACQNSRIEEGDARS